MISRPFHLRYLAKTRRRKGESNFESSGPSFTQEVEYDDGDDFSTLFIKNLNFSTSEAALRDFIVNKLKLQGLRSVSIQTKKNPNTNLLVSMGFGFAEFVNKDFAAKAQKAMNSVSLDSHALDVKPSEKRISIPRNTIGPRAGDSKNQNTKLLVKNVPFQATIPELKALFASFGSVKKVRIPKTMSQNHRGFAFVEFSTHFEASNAFKALKLVHLYGRHLVIEWAKEDDEVDAKGNSNDHSSNKNSLSQLRKRAKFDEKVISNSNSKPGCGQL